MKQQTGSKLGKEYVKAVCCHPAYLTYVQSTSCEMPGWMKHKLEFRLLGEISITSDTQMIPPLWQKAKRNQRAFDDGEKGEWKSWLKTTFKTPRRSWHPSSPITSWQIHGETMESNRLYFWGASKITADGDCSHEIKRCLLLGTKVMTNLDSILKGRDTTLLTKVFLVKAMVFP